MSRAFRTTLVAAFVVLALGAASARAFPDWSAPYSTDAGNSCNTTGWVDPVTIVFNGDQANAVNAKNSVEAHLGWYNDSGSGQDLLVRVTSSGGFVCAQFDFQRASAGALSDRKHIRMWRIPSSADANKKVAGTPHVEDWVFGDGCFSHAVEPNGSDGSGFDKGRRSVQNGFADHGTSNANWGNTRNFRQCNGRYAGSNGTGAIINMGHIH